MFRRHYRIPAPFWFLIVVASVFTLWHIAPQSLRNLIEPTALAATFTVNTTDDHDDGVCNAADCSLREAINAVNGWSGWRYYFIQHRGCWSSHNKRDRGGWLHHNEGSHD